MVARLEALEQEREAFAAMVAHDLRSPLTTVRGTAEVLQRRPPNAPTLERALATIVRESDRVARLRGRSRRCDERGGRAPGDPPAAGRPGGARSRGRRAAARGRREPAPPARRPTGAALGGRRPERIAQILDNLLGNAVKYSPPDQPIGVQVRGGNGAQVSVQDRGPGIAPEDLPHLFDRFYRTHLARKGPIGGTGLGCTSARRSPPPTAVGSPSTARRARAAASP